MKIFKIFEEFTNDSKVNTILNNMIQRVKMSFNGENKVFSQEELNVLNLIDIEKSTVADAVEKNVMLTFQDAEFNINVMFVIQPYSNKENPKIYKGSMKIDLIDLESTDFAIGGHYEIEIMEEDRGIKVKEISEAQAQAQTQAPQGQTQAPQSQTQTPGGFTIFENFIIEKVAGLKEDLDKQKNIE